MLSGERKEKAEAQEKNKALQEKKRNKEATKILQVALKADKLELLQEAVTKVNELHGGTFESPLMEEASNRIIELNQRELIANSKRTKAEAAKKGFGHDVDETYNEREKEKERWRRNQAF